MTSVRNHRLPLSGNKWLIIALALLTGACSPKIRQTVSPPVIKTARVPGRVAEQPAVKTKEARTSVISMILPLGLNRLQPGQKYSAADLKKANLSVDYYQGFKLALDSVAASGANFALQLFDTRDDPSQAHSLAYNPKIRASDLVVGPVFPEDIKAFTSVLTAARNPLVSPLSPASPATFKNQNLVTMTPPLEYHARGAAAYIAARLKPKKIFILRSGFTEENLYTVPFKRMLDSLGKRKIQVVTLTILRGDLNPLLPQLSVKDHNIFLVPSTQQAFLMVTLQSLDTLSKKYPVTVFGHPSWEKFAFLKASLLQRLNTYITSSDKVDYRSGQTSMFLRSYRHVYHTEPSDFAIKGFDEGLYFASLLSQNSDAFKKPEENDYTGIHNSFHFIRKPGVGWVNTYVDILKYENFDLIRVK